LDNYSLVFSFVFWTLLALSIAAVYVSISTEKISPWHFYNSDALYLPLFYKDLFSNYSVLSWKHPPAPYFFPDMPLYIIINFLVRDFHLAVMLYGVTQSLLFILSLIYLGNTIFGARRAIHALILLAGILFFMFLATGDCPAFVPILQNGYHFGATLILVLSLAVIAKILGCGADNKKAALYSVILFALSTLTLLSDAIYLVQFLIPALMSILLLSLFSIISAKQMFFIYAALTSSIPISTHLAQMLLLFRDVRRHHHTTVEEILEKISRASKEILLWSEEVWSSHEFLAFFWGAWIAFVLVSASLLVLSVRRATIRRKREIKDLKFIAVVVLFAFSIITAIMFAFTRQGEWIVWGGFVLVSVLLLVYSAKGPVIPVQKGANETKFMLLVSFFIFSIVMNIVATLSIGGTEPRYFISTIIIPLFFGWPFLFGGCKRVLKVIDKTYVLYVLAAGALFLLLFPGIFSDFRNLSSLSQLSDYYPEFVKCLDNNTRARNIRNGVAQYWRSKAVSALSKNNLHVVQTVQIRYGGGHGLVPEHLINNFNWYNTDFEFVITDDLTIDHPRKIDEQKIIEDFGEPADVFSCENKKILVYNREQDAEFQKHFKKYFSFDFYALQLPSETGRVFGLSRIAEGADRKGFLTYGPYIGLLIGDYYFEIHYYAQKEKNKERVGKWDILLHVPKQEITVVKKGSIDKEGNNIISGVFKVREGGKTEIRTHYQGKGILRVDKIKLRKIR